MDITININARDGGGGRGAARRLRQAGRIPAVLYGGAGGKGRNKNSKLVAGEARAVDCSAREVMQHLHSDSFRSSLLTLQLDGKNIHALVREVQMHPVRREVVHIDFWEVRADTEIAASVPLHFINVEDCPGVKLHHGIFTTVENQVAVHCLPKDLPTHIEVDAGALEIGKNIHLGDVPPPKGVRYDAEGRGENPVLAILTEAKEEVIEEEAPEAVEGAEGEAPTDGEGGETPEAGSPAASS